MPRTICLFRVQSVEDVPHAPIFKKVFATEPEFEELSKQEGVYVYRGATDDTTYILHKRGDFAQNVHLAAAYDYNKPEGLSFADATPSGDMKFFLNNPDLVGKFAPGQEYYITLEFKEPTPPAAPAFPVEDTLVV